MATKKIGSLWIKRKNNKTYLTGEIELVVGIKTNIAVMKNENKKQGTNQPDYNIVLITQQQNKKQQKPQIIKIIDDDILK